MQTHRFGRKIKLPATIAIKHQIGGTNQLLALSLSGLPNVLPSRGMPVEGEDA
jgi:hypothetical protein